VAVERPLERKARLMDFLQYAVQGFLRHFGGLVSNHYGDLLCGYVCISGSQTIIAGAVSDGGLFAADRRNVS
jgi:hypothetical protein